MILKAIPDYDEFYDGWWFNWHDAEKRKWMQPDFVLIADELCWVIESKRTFDERGFKQLESYRKLCAHYFSLPTIGIQVCQFLGKGKKENIGTKIIDPWEALELDPSKRVTLHYMPR